MYTESVTRTQCSKKNGKSKTGGGGERRRRKDWEKGEEKEAEKFFSTFRAVKFFT